MRRALVGFAGLSVVFACALGASLASGCGSSSDGGGGSGDDAAGGPFEAGPDGTTGVPPGGGDGGGGDGAPGGDASAGPFCASLSPAPALCEDFDDGTPPASSDTVVDQGATVGIDGAASLSPPSSYLAAVPAGVSGVANALLRTPLDLPASATQVTVSFAFRPETAVPASGPSDVKTLVIARAFVGASPAHAVSIELASEDGFVIREQEGTPPSLDHASAPPVGALPAPGAWTRYELTIDLGAPKSATLRAGGATLATLALTGATYDYLALNLGLQSDTAFSARYDDVVVDVK